MIPVPRFDRASFPEAPPWLSKYHDVLRPFFEAVASAVGGLRGVYRSEPFSFTVPDDWLTPTMATGWVATYAAASDPQPMVYRKTVDGKVEVRGRGDWTAGGTPTSGATITTLGAAYAPPHRETFDVYATDGTVYKPATIQISPTTGDLTWNGSSGGYRGMSFTGDVWWMAADRTPPVWASTVQPSVRCPFTPALVAVQAVLLDSRGRPTGSTSTHTPTWTMGPKGLTLTRCPGLVPLSTYRLTVWAFPE